MFAEPSIFASGYMPAGCGHAIYWEQAGNPEGTPIVALHGGPGSGTSPGHKRLFDPQLYRIVFFDQRGSGRSRPAGALTDNGTDNLVEDMELLRRALGIDRWIVFGASWGAVLALTYAFQFQEQCLGLALHAAFVPEVAAIEWRYKDIRRFYPEAWRAFRAAAMPLHDSRFDASGVELVNAYHARLSSPDNATSGPAAEAWERFARCTSRSEADAAGGRLADGDAGALKKARIHAHYTANRWFLDGPSFLDRLSELRPLPVRMSHGRLDMDCPVEAAGRIAERLGVDLSVVSESGHSYREPSNVAAIVQILAELQDATAFSQARMRGGRGDW